MNEIGSYGFPRVSYYGRRGSQVENDRHWQIIIVKGGQVEKKAGKGGH